MTDLICKMFVRENGQNPAESPELRRRYGTLGSIVGIIVNLLLFAGKIIVGTLTASISVTADAVNNLSDEAQNIVVIMNPLTKVAFLEAYAAGNFAVDPFQGLTVLTSGKLPAIDTASENDTYAIVGDLSAMQVNFPAGEGLKLINDPYSLAEKDLLKIVGRVYAGHAVTAPGRLVRLTKEAAAVTT